MTEKWQSNNAQATKIKVEKLRTLNNRKTTWNELKQQKKNWNKLQWPNLFEKPTTIENKQPNTTLNDLKKIQNKVNIVQAKNELKLPESILIHNQQRAQPARPFSTCTKQKKTIWPT